MIVAIELRNCSNCSHWRSEHLLPHKDGYAEAMCDQPDNAREKKLKRGSDYCQHWHKPRRLGWSTGAARPLRDEWGHPAQISHRLK